MEEYDAFKSSPATKIMEFIVGFVVLAVFGAAAAGAAYLMLA